MPSPYLPNVEFQRLYDQFDGLEAYAQRVIAVSREQAATAAFRVSQHISQDTPELYGQLELLKTYARRVVDVGQEDRRKVRAKMGVAEGALGYHLASDSHLAFPAPPQEIHSPSSPHPVSCPHLPTTEIQQLYSQLDAIATYALDTVARSRDQAADAALSMSKNLSRAPGELYEQLELLKVYAKRVIESAKEDRRKVRMKLRSLVVDVPDEVVLGSESRSATNLNPVRHESTYTPLCGLQPLGLGDMQDLREELVGIGPGRGGGDDVERVAAQFTGSSGGSRVLRSDWALGEGAEEGEVDESWDEIYSSMF